MKSITSIMKAMVSVSIILSIATVAYSLDGDSTSKAAIKLRALNSKNAVVSISDEKAEKGTLKVYSEEGLMLYKESIEVEGLFKKRFDFSYLPNGKYKVQVSLGERKMVQEFEVTSDNLSALSSFQPMSLLSYTQGVLMIDLTETTGEAVEVVFYNSLGEEIARELCPAAKKATFSLDTFAKGTYRVDIVSGGRKIIDFFNVN